MIPVSMDAVEEEERKRDSFEVAIERGVEQLSGYKTGGGTRAGARTYLCVCCSLNNSLGTLVAYLPSGMSPIQTRSCYCLLIYVKLLYPGGGIFGRFVQTVVKSFIPLFRRRVIGPGIVYT